ncbi:hypothetical protein EVAR_15003_1 [Eumeta japonica]|uniref:Uncharacterized protein n=1 Tax=Eumeta variegata TaxID=151549 RepID=A0A4C1X7Z0_EUMVA|nr:hypothetical protein EVAR_15003_1 [Eumeta japonica]
MSVNRHAGQASSRVRLIGKFIQVNRVAHAHAAGAAGARGDRAAPTTPHAAYVASSCMLYRVFCGEYSEELFNLVPAADFRHRSTRSKYHHHQLYDWRSTTVRSMQIFLPSSPSLWLAFYHRTLYADLSAIITIFMAGVLLPSFCHHHHLYGWRSTTVRSMQIFLPSSPSLWLAFYHRTLYVDFLPSSRSLWLASTTVRSMQIFLPSSPSLWLAFYYCTLYADLSAIITIFMAGVLPPCSMQIFLPSSPSYMAGVPPPYALCRSFCHHHHLYDWRSTTVRSMQIFLPSSPSLWLAFYHRTLYADLSAIITIFMTGVLPPYALCRSFCHHHHLYG